MSILVERWPGLASISRVELASLPTPVKKMIASSRELGSDVWVKRDDLTSAVYGGNKVRKLEYILGDAIHHKADTIITTGAIGSHHVLATSRFARAYGLSVHAVLVPQPWNAHVEENLRLDVHAGTTVHIVKSFSLIPAYMLGLAAKLRLQGKHPYLVPPGGSSPHGALGYVEAGLELARQIGHGEAKDPAAIYLALGSAGTLVGATIGLAAAGMTTRVVGVRVTDMALTKRALLKALLHRTVALLRSHDASFPDVSKLAEHNLRTENDELGPGYGVETPGGRRATSMAARDGLILDPTYTAKAFSCLIHDAEQKRERAPRLYWHTLSSADLSTDLAAAKPIPEKLLRKARA